MPIRRYTDPQFVQAVKQSGYRISDLATLAGFASVTQLSTLIGARPQVVTSLKLQRLVRVAEWIGYTGPIFCDGFTTSRKRRQP